MDNRTPTARQTADPRFRGRPICAKDFAACCELFREEIDNPSLAALSDSAFQLLYREGALTGGLAEDLGSSERGPAGCGFSMFITRELYSRLAGCSGDRLDRIFFESALADRHAVLRPSEVARANAGAGLHLFAPFAIHRRARQGSCLYRVRLALHDVFRSLHLGYNLLVITTRVARGDDLRMLMEAGGQVLTSISGPVEAMFDRDRLDTTLFVGTSREDALRRHGAWMSMFFSYTTPAFRFSVHEQALLRLAVAGMSDIEIARELGVSPSTVKKRWEGVYNRVADIDPHLLPEPVQRDRSAQKRGPEKRYRLIRYLANHPEELTPFDPG